MGLTIWCPECSYPVREKDMIIRTIDIEGRFTETYRCPYCSSVFSISFPRTADWSYIESSQTSSAATPWAR